MKSKLFLAAALFTCTLAGEVIAQKIRVESGSVKPVLSEKDINIQYDYSDMKVGKTKTEEEYIRDKVAEHNSTEPGKGDKWKEGWFKARADRYEPKFEELIDKQLEGKGIRHGAYPQSKYTLIVKTTYTEPGFNVGVMKQPAYVNFEFTYIETANPSQVLCKMTLNKVVGSQFMGYDFDAGSRIAESYAKGGKILGNYLESQK